MRVILQFVSCLFLSCIKRCYCKWKRKIIEKRQVKSFYNTNRRFDIFNRVSLFYNGNKKVGLTMGRWAFSLQRNYFPCSLFTVKLDIKLFTTKMFENNRIQFLICPKNVFLHAQTCYFERNLILHMKMKGITHLVRTYVRVRIKR